ncbi:hypothetical protein HYDPIDRAFT_44732 [Hydnomerulius pinastri MD-312]|uniref:F-box domain-containing protein n=1 Tax=Hydnomerulius pinastri MD-312 TaxID=994086 RepID=A0A0C9VK61_9AGAM|nr:hypothetical protein HYDPIDRAFT_44732 [Hydnomerulius pinastri MD-312]
MHRCLLIVEVQRSIFRKVRDAKGKNLGTLVKLARTCRAFSPSALDVLWEHLDSFIRLIQCLPRDSAKASFVAVTFQQNLQRPMSAEDWKVLFQYSVRVRSVASGRPYLTLDDQGFAAYSKDVIFALCHPPTGGSLIPHLKELSWDITEQAHASLLYQLLTPSVVCLTLHTTIRSPLNAPEVSVLSYIATACPQLKVLDIKSSPYCDYFLNGFRILSTAKLFGVTLDEQALLHVSRLQLTELSMSLPDDFSVDSIRPHLGAPAFGSITSLTVGAGTVTPLTSLLGELEIAPESVTLRVHGYVDVDNTKALFTALVSACSSEVLVKLCLDAPYMGEQDTAGWARGISLDLIEPLFSLPNISSFTLDVPNKITLDDTDMTTIGKYWPYLQTLSTNENIPGMVMPHRK